VSYSIAIRRFRRILHRRKSRKRQNENLVQSLDEEEYALTEDFEANLSRSGW